MHLLANGLTAIPCEAWLHPQLRHHLPALTSMARLAEEHGNNIEPLADSITEPGHLAALQWLERHKLLTGVYSIPMFCPYYCDLLVAEADKMGEEVGYEPNPAEEAAFQIPELVLSTICPTLFTGLSVLFERAANPLCQLLYGEAPCVHSSIQFARYEPRGTSHGNWHTDQDSDTTLVISLQPEKFSGGGTDIRTGPLSFETIPKLPKGHGLLFQGRATLHRGRAVRSGRRDLLVFWTEGTR
ncbi:2OG-Fe(II) oxygenase [Pseudomonas phage vB_PpuP-Kurepalu-1]